MSQFITEKGHMRTSEAVTETQKHSEHAEHSHGHKGSRLPTAPTAEVGRVDLRTPAVMVSPEKVGELGPGAPVASDRVRLKGAQDRGEGIQPVKGHAPRRLDTNMAACAAAKDGPSIRDRSGTHIAPATSGADVPALLDEVIDVG